MIEKNYNHIFESMEKDIRIDVWHLALILAILRLAYLQDNFTTIRVSRSVLNEIVPYSDIPYLSQIF